MGNIDEKILDHKLTVKQVLPNYKAESFHYQVLKWWYKIKTQKPETVQEIGNEYVFFNNFIVFDGVPIRPEMVGVENKFSELKLSQMLNSKGKLLSAHTLHRKLNSEATTFHVQSLIAAIPKEWRTKVENQLVSVREPPYFCFRSNNKLKELSKMKNNDIYWEILSLKIQNPTSLSTWLDLFPFLEHVDWRTIFNTVYTICKEPYLQSF